MTFCSIVLLKAWWGRPRPEPAVQLERPGEACRWLLHWCQSRVWICSLHHHLPHVDWKDDICDGEGGRVRAGGGRLSARAIHRHVLPQTGQQQQQGRVASHQLKARSCFWFNFGFISMQYNYKTDLDRILFALNIRRIYTWLLNTFVILTVTDKIKNVLFTKFVFVFRFRKNSLSLSTAVVVFFSESKSLPKY